MDSDRWRQITSSFPSNCPPQSHQLPSHAVTKLSQKPLQNPIHTGNQNPKSFKISNKQSESKSTDSDSTQSQTTKQLLARIQKLQLLLEEKSEIISEQGAIIQELKSSLNSSENKTRGSILRNRTPNVPAHTTKSHVEILKSVEQLESRMSKMMASLPTKIRQICSQYLSEAKVWEQKSGGLFVIPCTKDGDNQCQLGQVKPIWEQSPKVVPRLNNSSKIRLKQANQQSDHVPIVLQNEDFERQMFRLEAVVREVKGCFIELLLARVAMDKKRDGA